MKESIIVNPDSLEHSYVPEILPTREDIRKEIVDLFRHFFRTSSGGFRSVHLYGNVGTGKTVLSRRIGKDLMNLFEADIIVCYVNCRFSRRVYRVLADIARQISETLPQRGLSKDEFLELIFLVAQEKAKKLLIILDEIDSLFWGEEGGKTSDVLYSLSRFRERILTSSELCLGIISISREQSFIYKWLDAPTRASFIQLTKYLKPYTSTDLFEILRYRASIALREGSIDDETIGFLADFVAKQAQGNARIAIDLLRISCEIAQKLGSKEVEPEHIRLAIREYAIIPSLDLESLIALGKQKLILLLAIIQALKETNRSYVTRQQVQSYYREICREFDERPRKTTQIWRYLKEIEYELGGILEVYVTGKNQKGRSTRISINVPLKDLENTIRKFLETSKEY